MLVRTIRNKLPKCIFENYEIALVNRRQFQSFKNYTSYLSQRFLEPNMWLLVNHKKPTNTLYWNQYLLTADNSKSASGQLQSNSVSSGMIITINPVIRYEVSSAG